MYSVKNARTGKLVKDAITGKPFVFTEVEMAEHWAKGRERESVLGATAWNRTRPSKYIVVFATK